MLRFSSNKCIDLGNLEHHLVKFREIVHVFGAALTPSLLTQTRSVIDDVDISSTETIQ